METGEWLDDCAALERKDTAISRLVHQIGEMTERIQTLESERLRLQREIIDLETENDYHAGRYTVAAYTDRMAP
jgi:uncharacterized protein (DUF3084 family)